MATAPQLPPTASQPSASIILDTPNLNPAGVNALGAMLASRFQQYEFDRRLAELKWARNARQYLGIYDPEIETKMDVNRSRAYPKVTRVKCVSMLSRLMNLLFPAGDKNWGVSPSAVPDIDQADLQKLLDGLQPPNGNNGMVAPGAAAPAPNPPPTSDQIEQAIREFAQKRARKLELEIEDQLQELGGARTIDYVALCRQVIASGIQYGAGILKGPFVEEQKQRRWVADANGKMQAQTYVAMRPRFQFVPIWDYYPDMGAKLRGQMDGQFERIVMSKHQIIQLKDRPDFLPDQIDKFLKAHPTGNYRRRAFETELRGMGVQLNTAMSEKNKYEVMVWEGYVSGKELADAGLTVTEEQMTQDVRAQVWIADNVVIKVMLDPWSAILKDDDEMPMYHFFIFEEDETFLLGNALPNIMRDSQMGICAATRMTMDNASIMRVFEVNTNLLRPDQDITSIQPDKIFYREDDTQTAQYPAIRAVELPMQLDKLQSIVKMFQEFADQETFVGAATGGDMQRGPSEPFRTAAGASMIRGDAALPFKDVVRNFDMFTESMINAMIIFNQKFSVNPELKGDFKPVARGATSLIAKEVLGAQIDSFVQTLKPEQMQYVKVRELVRAQARIRDLDVDNIVMDDAACDAVDAQNAQVQQEIRATNQQMAQATIRDTLSQALKNVSQAGKNTAAADATTANIVLDALEKGVSPNDIIQHAAGGANADNVTSVPARTGVNGAGQAPAAAPGQVGSDTAGMPAG